MSDHVETEERREQRGGNSSEPVKLFVGNITYKTTEDELKDIFSKYGTVVESRLAVDGATGRVRGFAFVTMSSREEAEDAQKGVDRMEVDGREIRVEMSTGERRAPRRDDRRGGGDGGRRRERSRSRDRGDRGGRDRRSRSRDRRDFGGRDERRGGDRDRGFERRGGERGGDRDYRSRETDRRDSR